MQRSELGQSQDPIALVPGNPAAVRQTATAMTDSAAVFSTAGDGLAKIDDGGWTGQAADRFHEVFDSEPGRWITAGEVFADASKALIGYADTLEWAQGQAAEAIVLWEQAAGATRQAEAKHRAAVAQARADASAANVLMVSAGIPFHDPGEAIRQAAHAKLGHARQQLEDAGDHAEQILAQARDKAPAKLMSLMAPGSGANPDDGFTGGSLGAYQAAWCAEQGPVACAKALLIQRKALQRTNELADRYNWSTAQRNAFRHSYWMGLMTVRGFSYSSAIALGEAHEKDTDTPGELPGSRDSNADLHNNATGARIGVDVRPWYVAATGIGGTAEHERELEERLIPMLQPVCTKDGSLIIVE